MDRIIPEGYKIYGTYVNTSKMIPNFIDGLLPVQKRILLTAHLIAKTQFVKTAKILGECMSRFHPHSEALGTADWAVQNEFMEGGGQWGSKIGIDSIGPAAPRYTKLKANKFIEDLAFKYVDYVPWEAEDMDPEPVIIPTMLPFCLIPKYELTTIAFGFKPEIPCFKIGDLIKRLNYLLGKGEKITIRPNIMGCTILSKDDVCEELLTKGNAKFEVQGHYKIDEKHKRVYILGWTPRRRFQTVLDKIDNYGERRLLTNGDITWIDESNDSNGTRVMFEVGKLRNTVEIFEQMVAAIDEALKTTIGYNVILVDMKGKIIQPSIDVMLLTTYKFYRSVFETYLKKEIEKTSDKINDMEMIKKMGPHVSSSITKDLVKSIQSLSKASGVDEANVKRLIGLYSISKILTPKMDLDPLYDRKKDLENQYKHIEDSCWKNYDDLQSKLGG